MTRQSSPTYPPIPYGMADFTRTRANGCLYVDNTRFIPVLEQQRYVFLHRPPGFGKTCLLSMLEAYYDRTAANRFDALFGGTDIGANPTAEHNCHMVLRFDLGRSAEMSNAPQASFDDHCIQAVRRALEKNRDVFSGSAIQEVLGRKNICSVLDALCAAARSEGIGLYVMIDDYDHLAFELAARGGGTKWGPTDPEQLDVEWFFSALKACTTRAVERIFVTGTAPVDVNGLTGGFNIGMDISEQSRFQGILGLTEDEVAGALKAHEDLGSSRRDLSDVMEQLRQWCGGYRFNERTEASVYGTGLVFQHLHRFLAERSTPNDKIDRSAVVGFNRLCQPLVGNRLVKGDSYSLRILKTEEEIICDVDPGFSVSDLAMPENLIPLLYYFGLLSVQGVRRGTTVLGIPNQTAKQLLHDYLRDE